MIALENDLLSNSLDTHTHKTFEMDIFDWFEVDNNKDNITISFIDIITTFDTILPFDMFVHVIFRMK